MDSFVCSTSLRRHHSAFVSPGPASSLVPDPSPERTLNTMQAACKIQALFSDTNLEDPSPRIHRDTVAVHLHVSPCRGRAICPLLTVEHTTISQQARDNTPNLFDPFARANFRSEPDGFEDPSKLFLEHCGATAAAF